MKKKKTKKAKPVKAWGWRMDGVLVKYVTDTRKRAALLRKDGETIVRVEMREI